MKRAREEEPSRQDFVTTAVSDAITGNVRRQIISLVFVGESHGGSKRACTPFPPTHNLIN